MVLTDGGSLDGWSSQFNVWECFEVLRPQCSFLESGVMIGSG